ncbi:RNA-dependent RNA polymerase [Carrot mottle mimic virus]|uniref:RNA-dependent RNA polymerase n=1 Tax=Carrot mottle mimic virus TaxID=47736 RepID=UPI0009486C62|nr:RNA-dependent RNA polymerase [Carrot mottle mimic virus]AAB81639.2 RNA-dependent RNA polymerase [Carrot mottle mimic virus]
MDHITKFLRMDFSPKDGVLTRRQCAERFDDTWGLLITQARMTTAHTADMCAWYEGSRETNQYLPLEQFVDSRDASKEAEDKVDKLSSPPTRGCGGTTVNADGGLVENPLPTNRDEMPASSMQMNAPSGGIAVASVNSEVARWVFALPRELDEPIMETPVDPSAPTEAERELARVLNNTVAVGDTASALSTIQEEPQHEVIAVPGTAVGVVHQEDPAPVEGSPSTRDAAMEGDAGHSAHAGDDTDASVEMPTTVEAAGPLMEEGPSMAHLTSYTVAMELRSRFGLRPASPANIELGARVAREILKTAGARRQDNYYLAQQAVKFFLTPTLLDVVYSTPIRDFLLGDVIARDGVCTKTVPIILSPSLHIRPSARPRPVKRVSYQIDAVRPSADFGVHNNSLVNLVRGINERVFYTDNRGSLPVRPTPGRFDRLTVDIKHFKINAWSMEDVVNSYTGRQRARYEQAMLSIMERPLERRDARVSTFIKAEKINFSAKPDPAPRVIQPRDPRFNVVFAKYIKPLEPMLYKALGRLYEQPCVAKGFNAFQTGEIIRKKWDSFRNPVCVGLDASRFDQHVSVEALKFTHSVYKRFNSSKEFVDLLNQMYVNRGLGTCKDGLVKYKVKGCRMSGDMDTALGNCVLMVLMTRNLCLDLSIPHELMDNGDDCIVIFEKEHLQRFNAAVKPYFAALGFTMKVEAPVYQFEKVEFCQTQPVFDGTQWRMVRQIPSIAKDLCSVIDWEQLESWWHAIGNCGQSLAGGLPVFGSFYRWLCRIGKANTKVTEHPLYKCGMVNLSRGMDARDKPITTEGRLSFSLAFGLSIPMQIALEGIYDNLKRPGRVVPGACERRGFNDWFIPDVQCLNPSRSAVHTDEVEVEVDFLYPPPVSAC